MKRTFWLVLFALAFVADLLFIYLEEQDARIISKPLIVLFLIGYFVTATAKVKSSLRIWMIVALLFSLTGDIFLLFEPSDPNFFMLGLSAFLLSHIFYIVCFQQIRLRELIRPRIFLMLAVLVYYVGMIIFLSPHLGEMSIPVKLYAAVISLMLVVALHAWFLENRASGRMIVFGAILFITSDSLLAIDKFYQPFPYAGLAIMFTYALAQLFLTLGVVRYIRNER